jgi:hypothetical protein
MNVFKEMEEGQKAEIPEPVLKRLMAYANYIDNFNTPWANGDHEFHQTFLMVHRIVHYKKNPDIGLLIKYIDARHLAYCTFLLADVNCEVDKDVKKKKKQKVIDLEDDEASGSARPSR